MKYEKIIIKKNQIKKDFHIVSLYIENKKNGIAYVYSNNKKIAVFGFCGFLKKHHIEIVVPIQKKGSEIILKSDVDLKDGSILIAQIDNQGNRMPKELKC